MTWTSIDGERRVDESLSPKMALARAIFLAEGHARSELPSMHMTYLIKADAVMSNLKADEFAVLPSIPEPRAIR